MESYKNGLYMKSFFLRNIILKGLLVLFIYYDTFLIAREINNIRAVLKKIRNYLKDPEGNRL